MHSHPRKGYTELVLQKKIIEGQIQEMLKNDIIEYTTSQFSSPIVLVKNKDGSMRFCSDKPQFRS